MMYCILRRGKMVFFSSDLPTAEQYLQEHKKENPSLILFTASPAQFLILQKRRGQ